MKKTYDLTVGNPARLILNFYFPMLFTNLLQQVYNVVDTAIVGKGLGDNALGAVGNMSSITFFTFGFSMGLTNGFAVIIGQYFGAGDKKNLRKTIAASATLSAILAVLLTLISSIALRPLLVAMQTDPLILDDSLKYGHILLGCIAVTISYNLVSGVLRALGDSRTPLMAIIVATVINIVFDWIAINKWGMGVEGPA
jgi:Na+-driven multidrug efflux pump